MIYTPVIWYFLIYIYIGLGARFVNIQKKIVCCVFEMDKKKVAAPPLVCHGHSRPVVDLFYSPVTPDGFFLISASKGNLFLTCSFISLIIS